MGSTFAPSLACLYMANFEDTFIFSDTNPFRDQIGHWKRYIDDILITWTGTETEAQAFFQWINQQDVHLRFTNHISDQELPFLDLLIVINHGQLHTKTYSKPTDRNSLLRFDSHHPKALRENLPYGQFLRIRRNCSQLSDYDDQAKHLSTKLDTKGYPKKQSGRRPNAHAIHIGMFFLKTTDVTKWRRLHVSPLSVLSPTKFRK